MGPHSLTMRPLPGSLPAPHPASHSQCIPFFWFSLASLYQAGNSQEEMSQILRENRKQILENAEYGCRQFSKEQVSTPKAATGYSSKKMAATSGQLQQENLTLASTPPWSCTPTLGTLSHPTHGRWPLVMLRPRLRKVIPCLPAHSSPQTDELSSC